MYNYVLDLILVFYKLKNQLLTFILQQIQVACVNFSLRMFFQLIKYYLLLKEKN